MKLKYKFIILTTLLFILPALLNAGKYTGTRQSTRLYTHSDSSAGGGIEGTVTNRVLVDAFAMDTANSDYLYKAKIYDNGRKFEFNGLPVGVYDLMLLCADKFYEGMTLSREPNTLTKKDLDSITTIVKKSVPFFNIKKIHRYKGTTGRAGKAKCVVQNMRTKTVMLQDASQCSDIQIRSIKLTFLEDVNVGWQLVKTREIVRTEVAPGMKKGLLESSFMPELQRIRVIDSVKDLGILNLD
jgi:hypothetical protein